MSGETHPRISCAQRLRSWRNDLSLRIGATIRFSRGPYVETPCMTLGVLPPARAARIEALASRYNVRFELWLNESTSLNNYAYLDLLDHAFANRGGRPEVGAMTDVGCASFWYASALQVFFRPKTLSGYDVEVFRRYANGHTRQDYAAGYAMRWPGTRFTGADYRHVAEPADLISCWYPFVTVAPLLAWGLPFNLLKPKELFLRIAGNLRSDGALFMVNHGAIEADLASAAADSAGLKRKWAWVGDDPLLPRPQCPVASYWQR